MAAVPLHRLLEDGAAPGADVAVSRGGRHTRAELRGRAAVLSEIVAAAGGGRWLADLADPFAVAVALLGVAAGGGVLLLPPNRQPGTRERLARTATGVLVDRDGEAGPGAVAPLALAPQRAPAPRRLDPEAVVAELYTSGTAGDAKEVPKSLAQLDEVAVLEEVFGRDMPRDAVVFATASPHHLYGLLFRVLWPLASGRPLQTETLLLPDELLPRLAECEASVLVSTPAHLRRLAGRGELATLRGRCRRVFSSGGPLDGETADALAHALGAAPVEIFGSTETGGVAWREAGTRAEPFAPLPRVELAIDPGDGCLVVASPFVSVGAVEDGGARRRLRTADRASLDAAGRVVLRGRADRVVKVGEKRLALPEMESRLRAHPAVADCRLLTLEPGGEARTAAVVVPSDAGRAALADGRRRDLLREIGEHLARDFDRVLLPRSVRFVDELPGDERGKTGLEALRALFAVPERVRPCTPHRLAQRRGEGWLERDLEVPEDLAHLEGHFDGMPLVAGVVQLGWALDAARALRGAPLRLRAVEALKFARPLGPGARVRLRVEAHAERILFRLAAADADPGAPAHAAGRLRLEEGA